MSGAEQAIRLSSHREAFDLLCRAVRCEPPDLDPVRRAELLSVLAAEAAAVDDNMTADDAYQRAYGLYREAGEAVRAAALVAPWTAVRHLLGDDLAARVARLVAGLELLNEAVDKGETSGYDDEVHRTRRVLLAGLSAAYMLDRSLDQAIDYGERTVALAAGEGEDVVDLNAAATLGSVLVFAGRMDEGWSMLESAVSRARGQQYEAEAARAYRMLSTSASVLVEYERGVRWLAEGIEYAERVELDNHRHYMMAHLAHVHWATGDWDRASSLAQAALVDGRGGLTTRITALHVLGYLALGRGDVAAARAALEEARQHGEQMGELQRLSPALWGLAELALQSSDVDGAIAWCERGLAASRAVDDAAYLYPFLVTGARALLQAADPGAAAVWVEQAGEIVRRRSIPGTLPALAHAQGLVDLAAGRTGSAHDLLSRAVDGWRERNRFWEGAFAELDLARCLQRSRRGAGATAIVAAVRARAATVGAVPLLAAADAIVAADVENVPWHPLSAREFEVACMVADGLTNREVAARLVLAPKTVSAHVEHILAKLGFARRTEIAAWVATVRPRSTAP
jgi:ATP/maltotriose-dependent transcriptional regulator MalT